MMKKRKNGWIRKGIIAMVSALTIAASAGTVLAYEPMQWSDSTVENFVSDTEAYVGDMQFVKDLHVDKLDFSKSDMIFID